MNTSTSERNRSWHDALTRPLDRTVTQTDCRWAMEATSLQTHGQISDLLADDLACGELSVLRDGERIVALIKTAFLREGLGLLTMGHALLEQMLQSRNELDIPARTSGYVPGQTAAAAYWLTDHPRSLPDLKALQASTPPTSWQVGPLDRDAMDWAMDGLHAGNETRVLENAERLGPAFTQRLTRHFSPLQRLQAEHHPQQTLACSRLQVVMRDPEPYTISHVRAQVHLLSLLWLRDRDLTTLLMGLSEFAQPHVTGHWPDTVSLHP